MAIAREEIIGLGVTALTFETIAEAIELTSSRILRCLDSRRQYCDRRGTGCGRRRRLGQHLHGRNAAFSYHHSGVGRELGRNAGKDYTEEKTFHVRRCRRTSWLLTRAA